MVPVISVLTPERSAPVHMGKVKRQAKWALPRQAKGGESRDFHLAAFLDADFSQLFVEISRTVAVAEQPQDLIATCTERHIAWLSLNETPEDSYVKAPIDLQRVQKLQGEYPRLPWCKDEGSEIIYLSDAA